MKRMIALDGAQGEGGGGTSLIQKQVEPAPPDVLLQRMAGVYIVPYPYLVRIHPSDDPPVHLPDGRQILPNSPPEHPPRPISHGRPPPPRSPPDGLWTRRSAG